MTKINRIHPNCQKQKTFVMMSDCQDGFVTAKEKIMSELEFNRARLQRLMDKRGLSDGKLAKLTGMGRTTIWNLRTGVTTATSSRNLQLIADAMETTVGYLQGEGEEDDGRVAVMLPEPIRQLAEIATRLSDVRQEELIRIAQSLAQLEREQPIYTLSARAMEVLLDVAAEMGMEAESVLGLRELLQSQPPTRLIDLGATQLPNDQAQNK